MKLTVAIPTRNRESYLKDLLDSIDPHPEAEILVSDNASTDGTSSMVFRHPLRPRYLRNESNRGFGGNFLRLVAEARGGFVWVVGDDELLHPNAIATLIPELQPHIGLCVMPPNPGSVALAPYPFPSFRGFTKWCERVEPTLLLEHSLITCNVFRRSEFNTSAAVEAHLRGSDFPHMHGLHLIRSNVCVRDPLFSMRRYRAPAVDGEFPKLEAGWREYLLVLERLGKITSAEKVLSTWRKRWLRSLLRNPWPVLVDGIQNPKKLAWGLRRLLGIR